MTKPVTPGSGSTGGSVPPILPGLLRETEDRAIDHYRRQLAGAIERQVQTRTGREWLHEERIKERMLEQLVAMGLDADKEMDAALHRAGVTK